MAAVKVPSWLKNLPKEQKQELMKQHMSWKKWEVSKMMVKHLEDQLDQLILEDELDSPLSLFQSKWNRAKRLGQREALRKIINDLQE